MRDENAVAVAKDLIAAYGSEAGRIINSCVLENVRDGKNCGVKF